MRSINPTKYDLDISWQSEDDSGEIRRQDIPMEQLAVILRNLDTTPIEMGNRVFVSEYSALECLALTRNQLILLVQHNVREMNLTAAREWITLIEERSDIFGRIDGKDV